MNIVRAAKAGGEIQTMLTDLYCTLRGVHSETVIGAAAALAGHQALRATCIPLPKGRNRGGPQDQLLYSGEDVDAATMWSTIREMAVAAGARADGLPDIRAVAVHLDAQHDDPLFVPIGVPAQHMPHEWSPGVVSLFRGEIARVADQHQLSPSETAMALAFAIGRLIDMSKEVLAPEIGATIAAEIMIGMSRLDIDAVDKHPRAARPSGPGADTLSRRRGVALDRHGRLGARLAFMVFDAYGKLKVRAVESTVGALAALAGERALIATGLKLPSHGYIFGGAPDVLLYGTKIVNGPRRRPNLWEIVNEAAIKAGANSKDLPDYIDVIRRTAAAVGGNEFPALSVPQAHYPFDWSPNACPRFREHLVKFAKQRAVDDTDLAIALAWGVAHVIEAVRDALPPAIAGRLALEVMVGTSRMAPLVAPITDQAEAVKAEVPRSRVNDADTPSAVNGEGSLDDTIDELSRMLVHGHIGPNRPDTATLISAAAALAGEQARLSTGKPVPDDGWIRDDAADMLLFRGEYRRQPTLWTSVRDAAIKAGALEDTLPHMRDVMDRAFMGLGKPGYPPMSVRDSDKPKETPQASCLRLRGQLENVRLKKKLTHAETALALAQVIARLVASSTSPLSAATLAAEVMAGMSRVDASRVEPR